MINSLIVQNVEYKVTYKKPEKLKVDGDYCMGYIDFINQEIRLRNDLKPDAQRIVLLHEVMHAMAHGNGIDLTEQDIQTLAVALYDFLLFNSGEINIITTQGGNLFE